MRFFNFILFFAGVVFTNPAWSAEVSKSVGRLAFVQGEVTVDGQKAAEGRPVSVGQVVETAMGKCAVLLNNEHVIHLDVESRLKITRYLVEQGKEDVVLDLTYGKTRALIKSQPGTSTRKRNFNFRSRNAVMGVRGTHIYIESPKDLSLPQSFMTVEGLADVTFISKTGKEKTPGGPTTDVKAVLTSATNDSFSGKESQKVILKPNEMLEMGENSGPGNVKVVRMEPTRVKDMVNQIAPPPKDISTGGQVRDFKNHPMPGTGPFQDPRLPLLPGTQLPLDPIADALTGAGIQVKVRKY